MTRGSVQVPHAGRWGASKVRRQDPNISSAGFIPVRQILLDAGSKVGTDRTQPLRAGPESANRNHSLRRRSCGTSFRNSELPVAVVLAPGVVIGTAFVRETVRGSLWQVLLLS